MLVNFMSFHLERALYEFFKQFKILQEDRLFNDIDYRHRQIGFLMITDLIISM